MVQRSLVTLFAALGGILVILGGLLAALLSFAPGGDGMRYDGMWSAVILGTLAVIFGLVILVYSGVTHFTGIRRNLTGGIVLIVLGIVTWIVVGAWLLVAVGSFLTVVAGVLVVGELLLGETQISPDRSA
ncbi:MAG TPA: hypothetical protein VN842_03885 [Thermoplasmata archaeon]|nr:hypothetical protein [Thermoplasmata archaeon]